ncbi:hypothetical protein TIFTF001_030959 [Ficus carica]|uniref:Uncharacterized protein n=1 Tax=Ficus carica TaxID=3494 RepID=A0AA88J4U5_FICCA|nr:hypothetical protein TIFTF001_030959 [Ficus carica]
MAATIRGVDHSRLTVIVASLLLFRRRHMYYDYRRAEWRNFLEREALRDIGGDLGSVVRPFVGLPASVARRGVRCDLRHLARAVRGGSWILQELGCGAVVRGLGRCVGPCCPMWVACVPHVQPTFPPCCWPSFRNGLIAPMVAPTLMGVALLGVPRVDLAFVSPVVGVFFYVWDRGLLRLSLRGLTDYLRVVPLVCGL